MNRRLKLFAPAFLAVLALAAASASAAGAFAQFGAETYPASISGEQTESFKFESEIGTVVCKGASFSGSLSGASSQLSLAPTFKECTTSGTAVTVESGGCSLLSHEAKEVGEKEFESTVDVSCAGGGAIKVHLLLGCQVTFAAQVNLSDIHWNIDLSIPPRLELVSQIAKLQGKLEDTPGKKCLLGNKTVTFSAGGKASIGARDINFKPTGMFLK
ncbi:MAG TPA: hypothetical protein VLK89_03240 [Solirubrobacterales bacterium]|nr:hypothetical protein [Solirubrobacterales bacterium]